MAGDTVITELVPRLDDQREKVQWTLSGKT